MHTKEQLRLINEIVERAYSMELVWIGKVSLLMDLEYTVDDVGLRLEELLNADALNFSHDIVGIQQNMNRETKKLDNFFLPRFSSVV